MKNCRCVWSFVPFAFSAAACSQSPAVVAQNYTRAVDTGDVAVALEYVDPELKQVGGVLLVAGLNRNADQVKAAGGLKQLEVTSTVIDGDRGTVTLKHTFGNGLSGEETGKVRRVGSRWYVTM